MTGIESVFRITKKNLFLKTNHETGKSCISINTEYYLLTNEVHKKRRLPEPRLLETWLLLILLPPGRKLLISSDTTSLSLPTDE